MRGKELQEVEVEILEIFNKKKLTISEALFIFEKIKFSAFVGMQAETQKGLLPSDSMFR